MSDLLPFDDRDGWIWLNGRLLPWRAARLHVLSHGLHYASAVFEGERAYRGKVFRLTEHSQRLIDSARILGFDIPYTLAEIEAATGMVVAANGAGEGYIRPIAWRGSEVMGVSARRTRVNLAIAAWDWPAYFTPEARARGLRLALAEWRRPAPDTAPVAAKATGHYMTSTLAKHRAEEAGYDDALMLGWRGQVAEATAANIFFVRDGRLHTPVPDCFLDGITRKAVIALARDRQIAVAERVIAAEELSGFEEAFVTGTAAEVMPVAEIGPHRFRPGRLTETLVADFAAATQAG